MGLLRFKGPVRVARRARSAKTGDLRSPAQQPVRPGRVSGVPAQLQLGADAMGTCLVCWNTSRAALLEPGRAFGVA